MVDTAKLPSKPKKVQEPNHGGHTIRDRFDWLVGVEREKQRIWDKSPPLHMDKNGGLCLSRLELHK